MSHGCLLGEEAEGPEETVLPQGQVESQLINPIPLAFAKVA